MKRTRSNTRTRTTARIIPANGGMSSRPRSFAGRLQDTQVLPVVAPDITQELPRVSPAELLPVHRHTEPVPATAVAGTLPLPVGYLPMPPSARRPNVHHVLAELQATPGAEFTDLAAAPARIVNALGGPEPALRDPARRLSVRLFRAARDMARSRRAWCDVAEARLDAQDARIAAFAKRWAHDDAHWDRVAQALRDKQDASVAGRLVSAYADGGTSAALFLKDDLAHEIALRALAGSGVSR